MSEEPMEVLRVVWKYAIPFPPKSADPADQVFRLEMPRGAEVVHVDLQGGEPFLWATVDPEAEKAERPFFVAATGQPWPEPAQHVGTFQLAGVPGGPPTTVWHVFMVLGAAEALLKTFGRGF